MIKEAFLICALALPPANVGDNPKAPTVSVEQRPTTSHVYFVGHRWGGYDNPGSKTTFLREYEWIHGMLEKVYPDHDFLIIHEQLDYGGHVGWEQIMFIRWRGHVLYKRPKNKRPIERAA